MSTRNAPAAPAAAPAAPASTMPDTVALGFATYARSGYAPAVDVWARGSSLEIDVVSKTAVTKSLSDEENTAGTFVTAELIKTVGLSASSSLTYVFVRYQRGGLFMAFTCSKTPTKWLVTSINAAVDPAKVLPTAILSGD